MRKTLYILFLFVLITGHLSAKKRTKSKQPIVVETEDTVLIADSVPNKTCEFPMIMVGKTKVVLDTTYAKFTDLSTDTLNCDSLICVDKLNKELMSFFVQHIVYPAELKGKSTEETLTLRLKVDKNGQLLSCDVLEARNEEMKNEILRASKLLPTLFLFDKNGNSIDGTLELPISFKILKL